MRLSRLILPVRLLTRLPLVALLTFDVPLAPLAPLAPLTPLAPLAALAALCSVFSRLNPSPGSLFGCTLNLKGAV